MQTAWHKYGLKLRIRFLDVLSLGFAIGFLDSTGKGVDATTATDAERNTFRLTSTLPATCMVVRLARAGTLAK